MQSGRFILPYSHYPLSCSAEYERCADGMLKLQSDFDFMIDSGVSLYIGAHTHSYERSYPYYRNHSFVKADPPYISTGQYLISIV